MQHILLTALHRYVAMHTMQESGDEYHEHASNGYVDGSAYSAARRGRQGEHKHPQLRDTMLQVCGMLLPLIAQIGHAH